MFSDTRNKVERWPVINLFVLAGLLVVLCQLVALALVTDPNTDNIDVRDQRNRQHEAALADCPDRMQLAVRPLRHGCIQHVQAALDAAADSRASGNGWRAAMSVETVWQPGVVSAALDSASSYPAPTRPTGVRSDL